MKLIVILFLITFNLSAVEMIAIGCDIFNKDGLLVKKFSGEMCVFLDDGKRLESTISTLSLIDEKDNVVWSKKINLHHQMKLFSDKKHLAIMGDSLHSIMGCPTRFDKLMKLDIASGEVVSSLDFYNLLSVLNFKKSKNLTFLKRSEYRRKETGTVCATTHLNSISEITAENQLLPIFKSGRWLVNYSIGGIYFLLDADFKDVLFQKVINIRKYNFHDIQFSNDKKVLVYVNSFIDTETHLPRTVIVKDNPLIDNDLEIIPLKNNEQNFHQSFVGGIQELNDDEKLISIFSDTEGFELGFYDKNWKLYKKFKPYLNNKNGLGISFQEGKLLNLGSFLKKYRGQN